MYETVYKNHSNKVRIRGIHGDAILTPATASATYQFHRPFNVSMAGPSFFEKCKKSVTVMSKTADILIVNNKRLECYKNILSGSLGVRDLHFATINVTLLTTGTASATYQFRRPFNVNIAYFLICFLCIVLVIRLLQLYSLFAIKLTCIYFIKRVFYLRLLSHDLNIKVL